MQKTEGLYTPQVKSPLCASVRRSLEAVGGSMAPLSTKKRKLRHEEESTAKKRKGMACCKSALY